ncbi:acyl-CoA N-acyltransferase [Dendryphion nanum]|uniref:Acyl-CoA N-acyltransferase n=1 Tax=Dendryphion nanum TaxID=256645 RepID=A0A9P9DJ56_9PLEO|nr:acyl-CoA N-acyltransferase [Dendryphion nanum]
MPTSPSARVPSTEIRVERAVPADAEKIAEGLYLIFPEDWWAIKEPLALRPATPEIRQSRLAKRILPTLSLPNMHWIKAVHVPTSSIIGIAGWGGPGLEPRNIFSRSTAEFYGWKEEYGWSDEEVEDMWAHTDMENWDRKFEKDDKTRIEVVGEGTPHWYLAPLMIWPGWQGKGVGKLLLNWAIEQADAETPSTTMYLESMPYARAVYMHVGFEPVGEYHFIRKGPKVVRGLEAEEEETKKEQENENENEKEVQVDVEEVRKEVK